MHFFVNSTRPLFTDAVIPGTLRSNFEVVYDDITKAALGFEFGTSLKDFEALLSAQYVQYNMDKEAEAWHRPAFESALQLRYKWDPVIFVLDAFYRGKTPVSLPATYAVQSTSTGNMINIGLTVEYRMTKTLSFFLQGTNLLNRNEQQYYLYYTPGITVGGGLTCSF
jgi:outer membrane cobalamin receptor